MSDAPACETPECKAQAVRPAHDPWACEAHWGEFLLWQAEKLR